MTDDETKAMRDALTFGTGYMLDGKHVPMEAVMTDDLVKRLRIGIHTSVDPLALTNEAADRIEQLEAALKKATEYAGRLAIALSKQHYPETYGFKLVPDLLGIIDQIDHMTYGMIRIGTQSNDAPSAALGEKKDG